MTADPIETFTAGPTRRSPVRRPLRRLGLAGLAAVAALTAPSARGETFSPDDRAGIEAIIRDYLMEHPEVIVEALNLHQSREQEAVRADAETRLYQSETTPVLGNPDGDVTLVEFFDYNCGYCKMVADRVAALIEEDPGLRVVMKEFPILSPGSAIASRAALAAERQGAYEAMHFALMAHRGDFTEDTVLAIAEAEGLDAGRLGRDMQDTAIVAEIEATIELARSLGIRGTPAFIVGEAYVPGAADLDTLRGLIDEARNTGGR